MNITKKLKMTPERRRKMYRLFKPRSMITSRWGMEKMDQIFRMGKFHPPVPEKDGQKTAEDEDA